MDEERGVWEEAREFMIYGDVRATRSLSTKDTLCSLRQSALSVIQLLDL